MLSTWQLGEAHAKAHGETPYCCQVCEKRFSVSSNLATHMRTHTGLKPYCCQKCGKRFSFLGNLTTHMRTHTGEKPHGCQDCGRRFSQHSSLTRHMRTHTGEKLYCCQKCGKRFSHADNITKHMRTHTGWKPYSHLYEKLFSSTNCLPGHSILNHLVRNRLYVFRGGQSIWSRGPYVKRCLAEDRIF